MEIIIILLVFILGIITCGNFIKLNKIINTLNELNDNITSINYANVDNLKKLYCENHSYVKKQLNDINKTISIIANWEVKLNTITSTVSHNQSLISNNRNMIEETRNAIKSSAALKSTKTKKGII